MRRNALPVSFVSGIAAAAALAMSAAAHSAPVLVSGPSPFAGCTIGGPGVNYVNAEVEPWVAVNPANPSNVIGAWQQDRWSNGGAHGLVAGYSFDGGLTWKQTNLPFSACAGGLAYERASDPWVSIGPDGTAYSVSISFNQSNNSNAVAASVSTDGGQTWSAPSVIVDVPSRQQTIGNQIVVDRKTGTLYDFFDLIQPPFSAAAGKVAFIKSTDDGATWTKPQIVSGLQTVSVTDPNTNEPVRTGDIIPEPAIDPATGQLYVVWQDSRFNGGLYDEIALSTSSDGGATWSAPLRVNTPSGRPAFNPSVRVNSAGVVAVTYYDFRDLQPGNTTTLPTHYWRTLSSDGGRTFGTERRIAGPFDMRTAPVAEGFFIGDYAGLDTRGTSFLPFFVQTNSGNTANRTDVFAAP
ncbi:hypothetical protein AQ837_15675 [Burkholderia pseudomallei]|uniref:sialidase family protein n=1 Tax=Burkholderia pseudomallei TaxID=28450 RepID=UPI0003D7E73E|nr:sialidase family protein [Burkholderia pseudomallei]AHE36381.1 BNR repeat-like domain protein [Burkholderia pseudomallei NAU20B-16]AHG38536.1 BNR repeat-like domain protein [Burkholderia pseudomallei MSHR511]AHG70040.1 BNR repeat-like domain protein [Burkholderia pseudomallei MSHR146]OMX03741.1 hypothetical protein AQ819_08250 [Burkholderia pseudomallei]OMY05741.1 hypothetical protein AQ837_15675 [Burkholderia pseudomallei]